MVLTSCLIQRRETAEHCPKRKALKTRVARGGGWGAYLSQFLLPHYSILYVDILATLC